MTGAAVGRTLVSLGSKAGPFLICLALWQAITMMHFTDPAYLPGVGAVAEAFYDLAKERTIFRELGYSLFTAFTGLLLGVCIGVPLGAAMALSRGADGFFGPLVKATYSLPKSALIPLFVLWFGVGGLTNILATTLTTLLPIVIYTYHGVHGVPRLFLWSAAAFGTPRWKTLTRIILPAALPAIFTGIRIALGFAFIVTIAAEMIVSNHGIGKLMFFFGDSGSYNYMFAAVITIVVAAYLADRAFVIFTDHILRWQEPAERHA
jgi:ABC-type nitrate/sulfonate/bicarbonate transport system permease component